MGGLAQEKVRGLAKVRAAFIFAMAAHNIVRLARLYRPEGRTASGDMKSDRPIARRRAKNLKNTPPVPPQKVAPASPLAQTQSLFQKHARRLKLRSILPGGECCG